MDWQALRTINIGRAAAQGELPQENVGSLKVVPRIWGSAEGDAGRYNGGPGQSRSFRVNDPGPDLKPEYWR